MLAHDPSLTVFLAIVARESSWIGAGFRLLSAEPEDVIADRLDGLPALSYL